MGPFRPVDGREPIHVKREYIHSVYIYIQETHSKLQGKEGRGGGVGEKRREEEEEEEKEAPTPDRTLAPRRPRVRRLRPITGGSLLNVPWPNTSTNKTKKKRNQGPPSFPSLFENKRERKKEKYFSMQTGPQKCLKFNFFF